jgi:predicted MFS family arabinose efflux permease
MAKKIRADANHLRPATALAEPLEMSGEDGMRVGYGAALRSREFRAILTSQLVSVCGTSVAAVALTILVYRRTGSPLLASLTFALGFLPFVLGGGLLSGVVDRVRPRRLVVFCDLAAAALATTMAVPAIPVPVLFALVLGIGTLLSLSSGARAALVRTSVSTEAYVPARSLIRIAVQLAQIGGNAVGGALLLLLTPSGALLVNASSFLFSATVIRLVVADHANEGQPSGGTLLRDSLGGAREIFRHTELRRLLLLGWLLPMFTVAPEALAAPYVSEHGGSTTLVGWWLVALPLGLIAGDVAGVRTLAPRQQRRLVAPAAAAGFVPYLVFAADPSLPAALALLVLAGACGLYSLGLDGRVRDAAPPELFARAMTLNSAGLMTLQGLGFVLAGALAQAVGSADAIALAGCCGIATTVMLIGRELRPARSAKPATDLTR